jgi:MFS family permease
MNPLSLILGFLPLIAFNLLAGRVAHNGIAWGALVALAIALINMAITRPRWPPKIINLILVSLFLVLTLIGFLGNRSINGWLVDWASGLVTVTLGLLLLVTMPIIPLPSSTPGNACRASTGADPHSKRSTECSAWRGQPPS